jgi:hypothetical protein
MVDIFVQNSFFAKSSMELSAAGNSVEDHNNLGDLKLHNTAKRLNYLEQNSKAMQKKRRSKMPSTFWFAISKRTFG